MAKNLNYVNPNNHKLKPLPTNQSVKIANIYRQKRNVLIKKQLQEFELLIRLNAQELVDNPKQRRKLLMKHALNFEEIRNRHHDQKKACHNQYNETPYSYTMGNEEFCILSQTILEHFIQQEGKKVSALLLEYKDRTEVDPDSLTESEETVFAEITCQYEVEVNELYVYLINEYLTTKENIDISENNKDVGSEGFESLVDLSLGLYVEKLIEAFMETKELINDEKQQFRSEQLATVHAFFLRKLYNFILDVLLVRIDDQDLLSPNENDMKKTIKGTSVEGSEKVWKQYKKKRSDLLDLMIQQIKYKKLFQEKQETKYLNSSYDVRQYLESKMKELLKKQTKAINDAFIQMDFEITEEIFDRIYGSTELGDNYMDLVPTLPDNDDIIELKYKFILYALTHQFSEYENTMIIRQNAEILENPALAQKHMTERKRLNKQFVQRLTQCRKIYVDALAKRCENAYMNNVCATQSLDVHQNTYSHISTEITTHKPDGSVVINKKETISDLPDYMGDGKVLLKTITERAFTDNLSRLAQALSETRPQDVVFADKIKIDHDKVCGELELKGSFNVVPT